MTPHPMDLGGFLFLPHFFLLWLFIAKEEEFLSIYGWRPLILVPW
jgi:hypothetical protein